MHESGPHKHRPEVLTTIWGQTCDPEDFIFKRRLMAKTYIDDAIVIEEMGAYTLTWGSTFNGFPLPFPVIAITSDAIEKLKECKRFQRVMNAINDAKKLQRIYVENYEKDSFDK